MTLQQKVVTQINSPQNQEFVTILEEYTITNKGWGVKEFLFIFNLSLCLNFIFTKSNMPRYAGSF